MAPKPGVIPLRPLDIGEILNAVFATIRYNFLAVYGLPLITGVGCTVLFAVFGAIEWTPLHNFYLDAKANVDNYDWTPSGSEIANVVVAVVVLALLILVTYLATLISGTLSSIATLRHAVVGRRVGFRQILSECTPYIWRLTGTTLLTQLLCGGPFLLSFGVVLALALVANGSGAAALIALLGFLLAAASFVWYLYSYIRLVPVNATVVLEGKRPVEAIRRAWRLNEGSWGRALGVTLLAALIGGVIQYGVNQILSLFYLGALGLSATPGTINTTDPANAKHVLLTELVIIAAMVPVSLLTSLLTLPLTPLAQGLHYIDRRIRRESLDIQLAEEAGIPFHAPPPPATPAG
ncbi:hypothetical protein [Streptacidiphilus jiangxiensis]|uniref:Membrane domain of glycerophosphoryl diester phosphodiesterase n=1 Tax=Streptacidiphilus jiangxiensis TaxID=235985 RepID=A0A1H7XYR5_STRJI|nr:hypothetical protein [Streptacidiphilus jiangxiensis]SEM38853.1 hypothetical protein SAMN05414137_1262 [Streptacidiphilus jiangxiensis]